MAKTPKRGRSLVPDRVAGMTTGVASVPEAMASAILDGANPVQGLYAMASSIALARREWHLRVGARSEGIERTRNRMDNLTNRDGTKTLAVLLVALLALAIAGCTQRNNPEAQATATAEMVAAVEAQRALAGTAWDVAFLFEPDEQVALVPGTRLTTNFLADRYAGSSGCNWYLGVFSVDASTLLLYPPAQTQIVCAEEPVNQQEALFISTMANTIAYAFEGDQLVAYTSENQRLITYNPAEPVPFEGTQWSVKFLADDGEAVAAASATAVTARFEAGRLTGFGGCNDYEATYTVDGAAMTIGEIAAGSTVCSDPADVMEQEAFFLASLPTTAAYEQVGGMLLLFDANGEPILMLGTP